MPIVTFLDMVITVTNNLLDEILPWVGVAGLIGYVIYYLVKNIRKNLKKNKDERKLGDVFTQAAILVILEVAVILIFWWLPVLVLQWTGWKWFPPTLRWLEFAGVVIGVAYLYGHEHGGKRWLYSSVGHVIVLLMGWMVDRWLGILFISLPLILAYYSALYNLAIITLPTNNPEDKDEKRKRFAILACYTWGTLLPLLVVGPHAWKKPEVRIPGNITFDLPAPGFIWMKSHQVVGVTGGPQFRRVDGPGLAFMGKLERPFQVVDLRIQVRTTTIDVASKEGIPFKAVILSVFRIDPDEWNKETYDKLRPLNPLLRGADKPSFTAGSFHFSHNRVKAALGITSSNAASPDSIIYWDRWAVNVIEDAARKVISQKTLDELWRPAKDTKFANALDVISLEVKESAFITLRAAGILAYGARVVNFHFPNEEGQANKITAQQIATWGSEWERKRSQLIADAKAESERAQQEARAYAESVLLNSIAEGLQKTKEIHPDLPRYVIAMRFLSALQDFVRKSPDAKEDSTQEKKISELQTYLRDWQNQFLPGEDREKHR